MTTSRASLKALLKVLVRLKVIKPIEMKRVLNQFRGRKWKRKRQGKPSANL